MTTEQRAAAPLPASLPRMAVPLLISFTLRFLFSTVDLIYAALLDDRSAVAAIGFYIPFQGVYIAIWVGLSAGFTASLSAAFGHRDDGRVAALMRTMRQLLCWLVPCMSAGGVLLFVLIPHFGLDERLTASFRIYGTTLLVGMPLTGFWSIYPDSIVKAHYDTRATMMAGIAATATNITLNTLFVFAFGWGIFGIAFATVLSRLSALCYAMRRARRHEQARATAPGWRQDSGRAWPAPLGTILTLALPGGLTYGLTAAEASVVTALLADLQDSTAAIASYGVYHTLSMLALMPSIATSVAVLPYVARMVPEGHHAQVREDLRHTLLLGAGLALLFTVPAGWLCAPEVAAFFVDDRGGGAAGDRVVSPLTLEALRLLPFGALAAVPFVMLRPVFEALHQPRVGILVSVARFLVFSIPMVLGGRFGAPALGIEPLTGILCGLIAATLLASLLTAARAARSLRESAAAARAA